MWKDRKASECDLKATVNYETRKDKGFQYRGTRMQRQIKTGERSVAVIT